MMKISHTGLTVIGMLLEVGFGVSEEIPLVLIINYEYEFMNLMDLCIGVLQSSGEQWRRNRRFSLSTLKGAM